VSGEGREGVGGGGGWGGEGVREDPRRDPPQDPTRRWVVPSPGLQELPVAHLRAGSLPTPRPMRRRRRPACRGRGMPCERRPLGRGRERDAITHRGTAYGVG